MSDTHLERILKELKRTIVTSELTQAAIERKLGWSTRYITRLLHRRIELKYHHVFSILGVLGENPNAFHQRALGAGKPGSLTEDERRQVFSALLRQAADAYERGEEVS